MTRHSSSAENARASDRTRCSVQDATGGGLVETVRGVEGGLVNVQGPFVTASRTRRPSPMRTVEGAGLPVDA